MTTEPIFKTGDTGTTTNGWAYRVICDDLKGRVGPLVVAIMQSGVEGPTQYPADGVHPGGLKYLDLKPPKVRA